MFVVSHKKMHGGMSLVEVIVASALMVLVFGGLMASFQLMVSLIGKSKAESGALALANEQLEYIRALPYNDVGTVGGIPSGAIPQISTTTLNGLEYTERVLVEYVDDEDDGTDVDDENGIVADYKRVKIEYSWNNKGETDSLSLISSIVPEGIETTEGGGTLRVNVFDSSVMPVPGAEVHLYNTNGTTTIDMIRYTNASGVALISGAPALAGYEITVTKDGFSTDQTYSATGINSNPSPPHVAVLESQVSTMNFQIDGLGTLAIRTVGIPVVEDFNDSFDDSNSVATLSNTVVGSGSVSLSGPAPYAGSGTVQSVPVTPSSFSAWETFTFSLDTPEDTGVLIQLYSVMDAIYTLVSDTDLPGNSTGFATGTIAISGLSPETYPSLAIGATLTTSNASTTPQVLDWELSYAVSEPPIANVPVQLTGGKTIGTQADSSPVFKYQVTHTTDSAGDSAVGDIEWDVYAVTLGTGSYDIAEACGYIPYVLEPGMDETLKLTLAPHSAHSLRVRVETAEGEPIAGATVDLARPDFNTSDNVSSCGQVFFSDLTTADDYQLVVSAPGYTSETVPALDIVGTLEEVIVLDAS